MSLKDGFLFHWVLNTIHELRAVLVAVTCLQALTAVVKTAEGAPADKLCVHPIPPINTCKDHQIGLQIGGHLSLECTKDSGQHVSKVFWYLDGNQLDKSVCPRTAVSRCSVSGKYFQKLVIRNLTSSDSGVYKCCYEACTMESYALPVSVNRAPTLPPPESPTSSTVLSPKASTELSSELPTTPTRAMEMNSKTVGPVISSDTLNVSTTTHSIAQAVSNKTRKEQLPTEAIEVVFETTTTLIAIEPPIEDVTSKEAPSTSIDTELIAGLAAGTAAVVLVLCVLITFTIKRCSSSSERNIVEVPLRQAQPSDSGDSASSLEQQGQQQQHYERSLAQLAQLSHSGVSPSIVHVQQQEEQQPQEQQQQQQQQQPPPQELQQQRQSPETNTQLRGIERQLGELRDIILDNSQEQRESSC